MSGREPVGLYLHIPFCVRKCGYCDFLSGPADENVHRAYADALCREIRAVGENLRQSGKIEGRKPDAGGTMKENLPHAEKSCAENAGSSEAGGQQVVDTVFIGGGTPSVMAPSALARVMETVREAFYILPDAEITMEMNPGTFREELLEFVRSYVNRVSLGLQSADDGELAELGRIHTYADYTDCFAALREAGIQNINVDLMSAIPHQTAASWERTLLQVAETGPEHLSCYSLIIEEGTPFSELYDAGKLDLPGEDAEREMYYMTERVLAEYGYRRYEISNYAKPGKECRHNTRYWKRSPYIGFGIGAASLFEETRWSNTRDLALYLASSGDPAAIRLDKADLGKKERMEEFMFLGLRMTDGVSAEDFRKQFGTDVDAVYANAIRALQRRSLLTWDGDRLALTPRGVDVSNVALAEFLL